jgi:hypothetical protein
MIKIFGMNIKARLFLLTSNNNNLNILFRSNSNKFCTQDTNTQVKTPTKSIYSFKNKNNISNSNNSSKSNNTKISNDNVNYKAIWSDKNMQQSIKDKEDTPTDFIEKIVFT